MVNLKPNENYVLDSNLSFEISSLHGAYARGLSIEQLLDLVLERVQAAADPGIFIHLASRAELSQEVASLGEFDLSLKPLWGIPFAVKDNIDVLGMPTTAGCEEFSHQPAKDATVVALLKAAGAVVIGKTNLDQFATGLVGVRTAYPIPRNAIDDSLVPGGSSSGSAVATALGIVSFALGTDTAGSGRIPAGLNNIVGLKPSVGAISTSGVLPACKSLDCVSVFALSVADAYRVFQVAAKADAADAYSRYFAFEPLFEPPAGLKVAVPKPAQLRFFGDEAMQAGFEASLQVLREANCQLIEIDFEDFYSVADLLYEGAWVAERYAAIEGFIETNEQALHPVTRKIITGARKLSAVAAFRGMYKLQELKAKLAPVISSVDLIAVPTAPRHYLLEEVLADPIATNSNLGSYTNFVNLLDLCGVAVPIAKRSDLLPMSITLLASAGKDAVASSLAAKIHALAGLSLGATNWPLAETALPAGSEDSSFIELVVVGAHLSAMPLNKELVGLGAKFVRAALTKPEYRLYALAGQAVAKPGLQRVNSGLGGSIEVEVWSLDSASFGKFVAAIAAPLGIGTVLLADGTSPKGFLVEAAGLVGATDITSFGGWKNYVNQGKG